MPARLALVALGLVLAACMAPPESVSDPDACGATRLQGLVGQRLSAFDPAQVSGPLRVIGPDTAVTMDYSEARLNVSHDRRRIITAIACG